MKENTVCISLKEYDEMKWQIDLFKDQKDKITLSTLRGEETFYTSDFLVKELLETIQKVRDERLERTNQLLKEQSEHYKTKKKNKDIIDKLNKSVYFTISMGFVLYWIGFLISYWIFK